MHKYAHKFRKVRLTIATAITAVAILCFEIIPMTSMTNIPKTDMTLQQEHIIYPLTKNTKPEEKHIIAVLSNAFLFLVSDRKSTKYNDGQYYPVSIKDEQRILKRILIVDDNEDITLAFKVGIEDSNTNTDRRIEVHTSNNPVIALSEFKPNFYDLLLVDIKMPQMNGFELSERILAIDINVRICFMSSGEINRKALREIYPSLSVGCFIRKPVAIDYLIRRIMSELD